MNEPGTDPQPAQDAKDGHIDGMLRRSRPPAIADDGFTARVMREIAGEEARAAAARRALTPGLLRSRARRERYFALWITGGALVGALVAAGVGADSVARWPELIASWLCSALIARLLDPPRDLGAADR